MPKRARHTLAWSAEHNRYELRERGSSTSSPLQEDDHGWPGWLEEHDSFSFQGRQGHLTLLKEARARGSGYWYAYRSLNRRISKQYAGRTVDLTVARLEALAGAFAPQVAYQPQDAIQRIPGTVISQILDGPAAMKAHTDSLASFSPHVSPDNPSSQRHTEPLLEPKLRPPRLQVGLVERQRLFARMDTGPGCKLTLLCAPAGFGKTTLASQWLNARRIPEPLPPVAWISLDRCDNDPIRFWRYIITACQSFHTGVDSASLAQISVGLLPPLEQPPLEQRLTPLLNELTRAASCGLLILEDYHLITEARIHQAMIFFLDHLPATIHVMMLTRSEPPFPLVRWRARGELCEVQASDLRFSQEETVRFFQQALALEPIPFTPEELHQLHERVEGWAAGLRLLALTLQGSTSRRGLTRALAHFVSDQRSLQDYFVTEVLLAQPEDLQDFLVCTSMLNRLTGGLCDAVAERHGSARVLEEIERAGLFLEALDGTGTWYRYHPLFAEAMRVEARRRLGVDALRALHRRACAWYLREKMLAEAIETAFQAQDAERAAELIERLLEKPANFLFGTQPVQQAPEFHTLRRWLEQLPEALLRVHPLLCLGYAASLVFVAVQAPPSLAAITRIFDLLQVAEEGWRREGNLARLGEVYAYRAMVLRQPGAIREAMSYARQALDLLPADAGESRAMVLWLIGMGEIQEGHVNAARQTFLKVRTFCEAMGNAAILRANTVWLSGICAAQGEFRQAGASYRHLLAEARGVGDTDDVCDALLGLAQLVYAWNDLAMAEGQAQEAFELAKLLANHELQVQTTLILARIEQAYGRIPAAQQRCAEQLTRLPTTAPQYTRLVREIRAMQARLALTQGDFAAVERWWKSLAGQDDLPLAVREHEELLWARWQLAQGRAEDALKRLEKLRDEAQKEERTVHVWEIQILLAQAHAVHRHAPRARKLLKEVVERVHTESPVRLFLDEGETLATVLQTLVPVVQHEPQRAFLRRLLLAFAQQRTATGRQPSHSSLAQPLSAQEQRVLHLLAAGHSNPEIARELVVSLNTVKAHVQSIYRKLNVKNRVEASEVARLLKLL